MRLPDYAGGGLGNLVAELERRLVGRANGPALRDELGAAIPEADSYVLVLFDGLGDHQLGHPEAAALANARRAVIDAPFPTTTTVSLATLATGLPPAGHGLLGYQLWIPEVDLVVNTIKWITLWGDPIPYDYRSFLPSPNTWERIAAGDAEAIVLQPADFEGSPLTETLYRGARFEGYRDEADSIEAAVVLAAPPGRLIVLYVPHVDFAAHVWGQDSDGYAAALAIAAEIWERLADRLPDGTVAVGTADHGHVDVPPERRVAIPKGEHTGRTFYGDGRVMFVRGEPPAADLPARWVPLDDMEGWWGPGPRHPSFADRVPDGVLVADDGTALLHRFSDTRLIGQHGGLTPEEIEVPLLVAGD
jgi:hypothetical protein